MPEKLGVIRTIHKGGRTDELRFDDDIDCFEVLIRGVLVRKIAVIGPGSDVIEIPPEEEK